MADVQDKEAFRGRLERRDLPRGLRAVVHLGACTDTLESDQAYLARNNLEYSKVVLAAAVDAGVPLVYASSASVYGSGERGFREDPACEQALNLYAWSKLAFDQHVRRTLGPQGSTVVGLRFFNVYGENEAHKGPMASMVYQLHRQLTLTGEARLFGASHGCGPGEQRRDFVCVQDVVAVNLHFALDAPAAVRGIFNVGTGQARTFNAVARALIARRGGGRVQYVPFPDTLHGRYQAHTQADLTALRAAGYGAPFLPLEQGIVGHALQGRKT